MSSMHTADGKYVATGHVARMIGSTLVIIIIDNTLAYILVSHYS